MKQMNLVFLFILLILLLTYVSSIQEAMNVAIRNLYTKPEWKVIMERAAIPYEEMERCNVTYNYPPSLTLSNNILTVCLEEGQPPFTFNRTHGYIQEFMNLVKKELENQYSIDLTIQYHIVNGFFEIVDALDSGQCEVAASLLTSSKAKLNYVDFGCSHSATRTVLLRSGREPSRELRTKQSLNQPDVYLGVIGALEYSVSTNNFPSAVVTQCVNMEQCYNGVENNIFHAFIHSKMELDVYASNCTRVGCSVQTLDERFQYQLAFKKVDFSPVGMTSTLLPFGPSVGDLTLPKSDDYNQDVEVPSFIIHGVNYTALSLSTNGYISTKKEGGAFYSGPTFRYHNSPVFGLHAMDMDLRPTNVNGNIFYRQGIDNTTLQAINDIVHKEYFQQYLNQRQFDASWYFVYTMHDVSRYDMKTDKLITAQLVIASDPVRVRTMLLFSFPFGGLNDHLSPVIGIFSPFSEQNLVRNYDMVRSLEVESNVGSPGLFILRVEEPVTYISEPVCNGHYGFEFQSCNYPLSMCQENGICKVHECYGVSHNDSSVCSGNGACLADGTCRCNSGYWGTECRFASCFGVSDFFICSGHGECKSVDNCTCFEGWSDPDCSKTTCHGISSKNASVCSSHGDCYDYDTCSCDSGYMGNNCGLKHCNSIPANDSKVCSGRGTCMDGGICDCFVDHYGPNCADFMCFGVVSSWSVCNGRGRCVQTDNCTCDEGWIDKDCSIPVCYGIASDQPSVCSSHGDCYFHDFCACHIGYMGQQCNQIHCSGIAANDSRVCSGRGICGEGNICYCQSGYHGIDCGLATCFGTIGTSTSVCSGHGECQEIDKCSCDVGWTGVNCSIPVCYGISGDNSTVCSSHGHCDYYNTCVCNGDYGGLRCNELFCYGISEKSASVCNGKGTCIGKNKCQCSPNWTGPTCSIPVCHDQQVEGIYDPFNEAMTNQIWSNVSGLSGYSSWMCNLPSISHPFSFGGSDIRRAETRWMFENVTDISDRFMVSFRIKGCERLDFSEDIVVQIQTNSSLVTVARYTTDDYVNILNGELQNITFASQYPFKVILFQEMHSGSGNDGWLFGDFSILHLNQCSGYGFCSTANTCSCFFGHSGALCLTESCYGVSKNDSTVCSGRGACSSGLCSCSNGFYGEKCEKASCYGVIGTSSSVCSGHGDCWETDKCSCYEGWTDDACSTAVCHGISGDNSTVCSSNGQCKAPNECSCNYGYTGISCDTVTCNSKSNYDLGVCNGQGTCIEIDRCACNSYYEGPDCEFPLCHNSTITTLVADNFRNITKSLEFWETMSGYEQNPSLCSSKGGYGLVFSLNQPRELVSHLILANETLSGLSYSVRFWFVQGNSRISTCEPIEYGDEVVLEVITHFPNKTISIREVYRVTQYTHRFPQMIDINLGTINEPFQLRFRQLTYFGYRYDMWALDYFYMFAKQECSNNGICRSNTECSCFSGYEGILCETYNCFGYKNSSACSGRGQCIAADTCICHNDTEWSGPKCNTPFCHGIRSDNSLVCSGHGTCEQLNTCVCNSGWVGSNCELPICYSLNSSNPQVCSGNGACISPNFCKCDRGYSGHSCSLYSCYEVEKGSSAACSSHGTCTAPNTCVCRDGYVGADCSSTSCHGSNTLYQETFSTSETYGMRLTNGYYGSTNREGCGSVRGGAAQMVAQSLWQNRVFGTPYINLVANSTQRTLFFQFQLFGATGLTSKCPVRTRVSTIYIELYGVSTTRSTYYHTKSMILQQTDLAGIQVKGNITVRQYTERVVLFVYQTAKTLEWSIDDISISIDNPVNEYCSNRGRCNPDGTCSCESNRMGQRCEIQKNITGCIHPLAINYNPDANLQDSNSCSFSFAQGRAYSNTTYFSSSMNLTTITYAKDMDRVRIFGISVVLNLMYIDPFNVTLRIGDFETMVVSVQSKCNCGEKCVMNALFTQDNTNVNSTFSCSMHESTDLLRFSLPIQFDVTMQANDDISLIISSQSPIIHHHSAIIISGMEKMKEHLITIPPTLIRSCDETIRNSSEIASLNDVVSISLINDEFQLYNIQIGSILIPGHCGLPVRVEDIEVVGERTFMHTSVASLKDAFDQLMVVPENLKTRSEERRSVITYGKTFEEDFNFSTKGGSKISVEVDIHASATIGARGAINVGDDIKPSSLQFNLAIGIDAHMKVVFGAKSRSSLVLSAFSITVIPVTPLVFVRVFGELLIHCEYEPLTFESAVSFRQELMVDLDMADVSASGISLTASPVTNFEKKCAAKFGCSIEFKTKFFLYGFSGFAVSVLPGLEFDFSAGTENTCCGEKPLKHQLFGTVDLAAQIELGKLQKLLSLFGVSRDDLRIQREVFRRTLVDKCDSMPLIDLLCGVECAPPPPPPPPPVSVVPIPFLSFFFPSFGMGWGDPHFVSIDDHLYTFNGIGDYWYLQSWIQIQVRLTRQKHFSNGNASFVDAVAVKIGTHTVEYYRNNFIFLNGVRFRNSSYLNGNVIENTNITLKFENNELIIETEPATMKLPNGQVVRNPSSFRCALFTSGDVVNYVVSLPMEMQRATRGLIGVWDGNPDNDLLNSSNVTLPSNSSEQTIYYQFGRTWAVTTSESFFTIPLTGSEIEESLTYTPTWVEDVLSNQTLVERALPFCTQFDEGKKRNLCVYDVTVTGSTEIAQAQKSSFAVAERTLLLSMDPFVPQCSLLKVDGYLHELALNYTSMVDRISSQHQTSFVTLAHIIIRNSNLSSIVWQDDIEMTSNVSSTLITANHSTHYIVECTLQNRIGAKGATNYFMVDTPQHPDRTLPNARQVRLAIIIGSSVGGTLVLCCCTCLVLICICCIRRRKREKQEPNFVWKDFEMKDVIEE